MHLLVYAVFYALWHGVLRRHAKPEPHRKWNFPNQGVILLSLVLLAGVTFVARIPYPIDTWKNLLGLPTEIAHLPQYLSLFVIGILSYHHDWFRRLLRQQGFAWLGIGLGAVLLRYVYTLSGETLFPTRIIAGGDGIGDRSSGASGKPPFASVCVLAFWCCSVNTSTSEASGDNGCLLTPMRFISFTS